MMLFLVTLSDLQLPQTSPCATFCVVFPIFITELEIANLVDRWTVAIKTYPADEKPLLKDT